MSNYMKLASLMALLNFMAELRIARIGQAMAARLITIGMLALTLFDGAAVSSEEILPKEVGSFIKRKDMCDHLRGEEPLDKIDRTAWIKKTNKYCRGTDTQLERLRNKYKGNEKIESLLQDYAFAFEK